MYRMSNMHAHMTSIRDQGTYLCRCYIQVLHLGGGVEVEVDFEVEVEVPENRRHVAISMNHKKKKYKRINAVNE
jgi:hypothetical protein